MPNNVTNQLAIKSSVKGAVKSFYESLKRTNEEGKEEYYFDFEKFITMPEVLKIQETSQGYEAVNFLKAFEGKEYTEADMNERGLNKDDIELGKKYLNNINEYGYRNWYNWRVHYWGTKWNSYDNIIEYESSKDILYIQFDTAWSAPIPIIKKLAKDNPSLEGRYVWADENSGFNTGRGDFSKGNLEIFRPDDESNDAWDVFFETHPTYRNDYVYTPEGEWRYKSDYTGEIAKEPNLDSDLLPTILRKARTLLAEELCEVRNESFRNWNDCIEFENKYKKTLKELNSMRYKLGLPEIKDINSKEEESL